MIKVLILEDEQLAADDLEKLLKSVKPEYSVLSKIGSVTKAKEYLSANSPDLILSDIQLADGTCFDIFEEIDLEIPIIFTTAYNQYAIKAFKEFSIDYLLKPFGKQDLELALDKFEKIQGAISRIKLNDLHNLILNSANEYQQRFRVNFGDRYLSITTDNIAYFFSEERYTYLVTKENKQHIINSNLTELESRLNPKDFFRINRKIIVSFSSITKMIGHTKSRVKLDLQPPLPYSMEAIVSVEKSGEFKHWLNK